MDFRGKITNLRNQAFQKIGNAAKNGQAGEISRLARVATECDTAMQTLQSLESQIARIEADLQRSDVHSQTGETHHLEEAMKTVAKNQVSPRERANRVRTAYVKDLNHALGIRLDRRSEVVYKTQSGKVVGLPYASELDELPDRWWLGLPDEHFDFVILLCETDAGALLDFVFPSDFIREIWNSLSRDNKHHVKLNIFRSGANYDLRLKDGDTKKIQHLRGTTTVLS